MNILEQMLGGSDDAALFGVNSIPSTSDITEAQRVAMVYGEAAEALVARAGLRKGLPVNEQPVFGPLVRMLSLAGWTLGGSGYFSAVFYNGGLAIKLSLRGETDAAMDYLNWCKDHQDMPGVPQVYAMKQSDNTYTVLMDRLEGVGHLLRADSSDYDEFVEAEYKEIKEALNTGAAPLYFKTGATALAIRDKFRHSAHFDIHRGNVMQDRDGKLVITDPLGRSMERPGEYGGDYTYDYYTPHSGTGYRHAA